MNRRDFTSQAALLGTLSLLLRPSTSAAAGTAPSAESADQHHQDALKQYAALTEGPKVTIGMLVYPGMFLQDLVGPLTVFESLMNRDIHLLWKNKSIVGADGTAKPPLIPVTPTTSFAECPDQLDVLFVPGGVPGTFTMMEDKEVLSFLAAKGKSALTARQNRL